MAKWKIWLPGIIVVIIDIAIFLFLELILMAYDDRHGDPDAVDYYKWSSYSATNKIAVVSLFVWWSVNLTAICYVLYRLVNRWLRRINTVK